MNIAIIGTGNVGAALTKGWTAAGHNIFLGVRDQANFKGKALLDLPGVSLQSIVEAIAAAEVVVLAVPPQVMPEMIPFLEQAEDKVVIDPSNSFPAPPKGYDNSFAPLVKHTACKHLVKAFNTTGFGNMPNGEGLDMFMAGDSERAKKVVSQLSADLGFANCYDFGGSDKAGLQEQLAIAWINLAIFQNLGPNIGINVVKRA